MTTVISHSLYPVRDFEHRFYHGNPYHCISAKITLDWDENGVLSPARRQIDLLADDLWRDRENRSSLIYASDLIPFKPCTDVVVTGTVRPPDARPTPLWYAALRIGKLEKRLRFYGPRQWQFRLFGGWTLSDPEPTEGVGLLYENAYGGVSFPENDTFKEGEYDPNNPVGCGYIGKARTSTARSYPAAQIESWDGRIKHFGRDVPPGGFGPLPGHAPDRYRHIGTWDERWQKEVAPHIPLDMDMRYWNVAPADQQTGTYLKSGDLIELAGVRPGPPLCLRLPPIDATTVRYQANRTRHARNMNLDTVAIDLDLDRITLRYHRILPFDAECKSIHVHFTPVLTPVVTPTAPPAPSRR